MIIILISYLKPYVKLLLAINLYKAIPINIRGAYYPWIFKYNYLYNVILNFGLIDYLISWSFEQRQTKAVKKKTSKNSSENLSNQNKLFWLGVTYFWWYLKNSSFWHSNSHFVLKTKVFIIITEIFWRTFWLTFWRCYLTPFKTPAKDSYIW